MSSYSYPSFLTTPDVEIAVVTAGTRGHLKAIKRLCAEIQRNRYCRATDKRRAAKLKAAASGALALIRTGGR